MKKYLSILLAMMFVFGLAAGAFAMQADIPAESTAAIAAGATQVTLSGEIRVRYDWRHVGFNSSDSQTEYAFMNERLRLGVDAKLSPNTEGMIQLTSFSSSAQADPDNLVGGGGYAAAKADGSPAARFGNEFNGTVAIRQMWILHQGTGLLGTNAGIKVGHMPLILGSGLFFDHSYFGDDAVIAFVQPTKELELDAIVVDFSDAQIPSTYSAAAPLAAPGENATLSNKNHGYVFVANYKPSKTTGVSFDATYVDDQNIGETTTGAALYPSIHLWNFGLRGNTEVSGFTLKADGEVQTGTLEKKGATTVDISGYALQAGVGYTLDPVKLDLQFGYGSGDNGSNPNKLKTFITSQGPESTFGDPYRGVGIQGGIQGPYVYNYRTVNAANNSFGGLQNAWYVRVGGDTDLTKDTNFDVALFYLQAVDAITSGNVGTYGFGSSAAQLAADNGSKNIGFETDARLTYKIDKGLVTWVEGGYLWAGDFWKAVSTVTAGSNPSNCYTARTGIQLNF